MKTARPAALSGTAALEKCLVLFHRIVADRGCTCVTELAGNLGLPRSTLYRMTGVLERAGFIARIRPGYFSVGLGLAEDMYGVTPNRQIQEASRPLLQELADKCGATAHLGVMENDMVTYVVKVSAGALNSGVSFSKENAQLEAYCSGIGKVLLAWLPEAEREKYLAGGPFVALTERTILDPAVLRNCLKTVRTDRYARDNREVADDLYCLAVPLWVEAEPMYAAISLSFTYGNAKRGDDRTYVALLQDYAMKISRKLGKM
jgi:IclR family acetate operon transcriptional repressor